MKIRAKDRSLSLICICAALLVGCFWMLACYLIPPESPEGGTFGMVLLDVDDEQTAASYHVEECGVYVLAVQENSAAAHAGVSSGDRLMHVNEQRLSSSAQFVQMQESFSHMQPVLMQFSRGHGEKQTYQVSLVWNAE